MREIYLEKIRPYIGKKLIKVLTGQRRVGKSFLLKELWQEISTNKPNKNLVFIDMELYEFNFIKNYHDIITYFQNNKVENSDNILMIDEIQEIEHFEKAVRSLLIEGVDIYISGSNANLLSGELATLLSGRYIEIHIHPFTYLEFLQTNACDDTEVNFQKYLQFGGMPGLSELPDLPYIKIEYLKNVYNSILLHDVVKRNQIRNVTFLENLVNFLADNLGSIVSANKISEYLKSQKVTISVNTVLEYSNYLTNSLIIHKVSRKDIFGKKNFEVNDKYYFEDIGLRNILVGYRITDIHKLLENIVYNHLIASDYKVSIGVLGLKEIDFVAEKNGETTYFQVAYLLSEPSTIDREFGNLLSIKDQFDKYVISTDSFFSTATYLGIKHLNIRKFLMNFK